MEYDIRRIVSDILDIPQERIDQSLEIRKTPEWDSLRHMQLVVAIEQNFGIGPLSAEEIVSMTRYANIAAVVRARSENGRNPA